MSKKKKRISRKLKGKVLAFNVSPKGHVEGVLVALPSRTAQLNFPRHEGHALSSVMATGSSFELASGKIVRLNYALRGDVNGYHLDEGTFVHVKPKSADKYQMEVGEHVHATGRRHPGADAIVLEAWRVERLVAPRVASVRS